MGFWQWPILGWIVGKKIGEARAGPKPVLVETEQLGPDYYRWYTVRSDGRQTVELEVTIRGPPISVEFYPAVDFERRKRGEPADPLVAEYDVDGELRLSPRVDAGEYTVLLYREAAELARRDTPPKEGISDFELKVWFS